VQPLIDDEEAKLGRIRAARSRILAFCCLKFESEIWAACAPSDAEPISPAFARRTAIRFAT
jgi:hypothetical protein